jgi:hypothetical protein
MQANMALKKKKKKKKKKYGNPKECRKRLKFKMLMTRFELACS